MSNRSSASEALPEKLVRVVAPHFVAGLITDGKVCVTAAPILRWAIGKTEDELRAYFKGKGWQASVLAARESVDLS